MEIDPTINFDHFSTGDIFWICIVALMFCMPMIWCYYYHKIESLNKEPIKQQKTIPYPPSDHEEYPLHIQLHEKVKSAQYEKTQQYEIERMEIERLWSMRNGAFDVESLFDIKSISNSAQFERYKSDGIDSIAGPSRGSSRYSAFVITV